jgi:hypothetical protein
MSDVFSHYTSVSPILSLIKKKIFNKFLSLLGLRTKKSILLKIIFLSVVLDIYLPSKKGILYKRAHLFAKTRKNYFLFVINEFVRTKFDYTVKPVLMAPCEQRPPNNNDQFKSSTTSLNPTFIRHLC